MREAGWTSFEVELEPKKQTEANGIHRDDNPYRILVLGNFRGLRPPRTSADWLRTARPVQVDAGTIDDVIASLHPQLRVAAAGQEVPVDFRSLEDFHPDALYQRLPLLQSLHAAKEKAETEPDPTPPPEKSEPAAAEQSTAPPQDSPEPPLSGGFLDAILSRQPSTAPVQPPPPRPRPQASTTAPSSWKNEHDFARAIESIVSPYLQPAVSRSQAAAVENLDRKITDTLQQILHGPSFQELEAAWRSVEFLIRHIETSATLQLWLLDLSYSEWLEALPAGQPSEDSSLFHLLVESVGERFGGSPFNALIALYQVSPAAAEVGPLAQMGEIAGRTKAPFFAAATPAWVGAPPFETLPGHRADIAQWKQRLSEADAGALQAARTDAASRWIGLTLPRILLRLPYGRHTSSIDAFDFEEMPNGPVHNHYLWGTGALTCACALASGSYEVTGVPLHTWREDGEVSMTPCAEIWLNERAVEALFDAGIMPVASLKDRDSVRLLRFQAWSREHPELPVRFAE